MRENYKRLGDYIRPVNIRNKDLRITKLLGVSIQKILMPSIANTVGTNMKTYKIINRNQFAYGSVTSRNGDKISIALLQDFDEAIISQAYTVFEVIDTNEVNPEYLMMWFRRPEFDRYARFKSHGSARETFDWDEMCEVELPIPSIEKQNAIVKEYNTVVNRIKLNEQLNKKLEETAQAIYKHWFVDFNFPNEDGKPYKLSGGRMVWNEVLGKEIPEGWEVGSYEQFVRLSQGQVINAKTRHLIKEKGLPLLRITDLINDTRSIFIDESVNPKNIASKDDIIYSRTGQVGLVFKNKIGVVYNNCFKVIPKDKTVYKEYIYWLLKQKDTYREMVELASASAQPDLTHKAFFSVSIFMPDIIIQKAFSNLSIVIDENMYKKHIHNLTLVKMKNILLSKMSNI